MPPRTRRRARVDAVGAVDAVVAHADCWSLIGHAVLNTHDLETYANWRLAAKTCLATWQENFEAAKPWLGVWPETLEVLFWNLALTEAGNPGGNAADQVMDATTMPAEWRHVLRRGHRLAVVSEARLIALRHAFDANGDAALPPAPPAPAPPFSLADFRLHVAVYKVESLTVVDPLNPPLPKYIFVGSTQVTKEWDHTDVRNLRNFAEMENCLDPFEDGRAADAVRLYPDDEPTEYLNEVYLMNSAGELTTFMCSAFLSRSDGAVACLCDNVEYTLSEWHDAQPLAFELEGTVDRILNGPLNEGADADAGRPRRGFVGIALELDFIYNYSPYHEQWNEELRGQFNELVDDAAFEDSYTTAVFPSVASLEWHTWADDGLGPPPDEETWPAAYANEPALPTPSEEEMVARFMRLAWAEEGVALTAEEEAAVSSTISADIAADIAAGAPILHEE